MVLDETGVDKLGINQYLGEHFFTLVMVIKIYNPILYTDTIYYKNRT